jgi:hypothetical protein
MAMQEAVPRIDGVVLMIPVQVAHPDYAYHAYMRQGNSTRPELQRHGLTEDMPIS